MASMYISFILCNSSGTIINDWLGHDFVDAAFVVACGAFVIACSTTNLVSTFVAIQYSFFLYVMMYNTNLFLPEYKTLIDMFYYTLQILYSLLSKYLNCVISYQVLVLLRNSYHATRCDPPSLAKVSLQEPLETAENRIDKTHKPANCLGARIEYAKTA